MKTCEEITKDIERGFYQDLSLKERLAIKVHLVICKPCQNYEKDSNLIHELLLKKYKDLREYKFSLKEKEALKERIK